MDLYPAIDLRHGRVVRLTQGEATRPTVYGDDPVAQAEAFVAEGARWIHLVDLDRAFGEGDQSAVIARVAAAVAGRVRLQLGGGLRSLDRVRSALDTGAARIVLGTAAVTDPALVDDAVALAGVDAVAVGLDARDGMIVVRGWRETAAMRAVELARRVAGQGVRTVIHTDVGRDGMLVGPDLDGAAALAAVGLDVIASGGVGSLADLTAVAARGLAGAIVGRALYEGRFTLSEALAAAG